MSPARPPLAASRRCPPPGTQNIPIVHPLLVISPLRPGCLRVTRGSCGLRGPGAPRDRKTARNRHRQDRDICQRPDLGRIRHRASRQIRPFGRRGGRPAPTSTGQSDETGSRTCKRSSRTDKFRRCSNRQRISWTPSRSKGKREHCILAA